jgi:regulator of chromosome condensation
MCGGIHNSALTKTGELYTWGCGSDGRLGHPEIGAANYLYKESLPKKLMAL